MGLATAALVVYDGITGQLAYRFRDDSGGFDFIYIASRTFQYVVAGLLAAAILAMKRSKTMILAVCLGLGGSAALLAFLWDPREFETGVSGRGIDYSHVAAIVVAVVLHCLAASVALIGILGFIRRLLRRNQGRHASGAKG